jgi:hypothetical protein
VSGNNFLKRRIESVRKSDMKVLNKSSNMGEYKVAARENRLS